jgi:Fe-S-cluster-containing dehydrogenase component
MSLDRRSLIKGAAAAATAVALPASSFAASKRLPPDDALGLLYDATKCIGCKACVVACKQANNLPSDPRAYGDGLYDSPHGLNEFSKTVIQLHKDGDEQAFVKKQCMHCVDPACVNGCMIGALQKGKHGIVTWNEDKCVGCRYCQVACPFEVPKFEWSKRSPKIVKCELCQHRLAEGKEPGCTEVCPRKAVIFGPREALLRDAKERIAADPDVYFPKVYGETDLGGTQVLYLSAAGIPFEKLGFRFAGDESVPSTQRAVQHGIYQGFVAPVALYAALSIVMFRNRAKRQSSGDDAGEK